MTGTANPGSVGASFQNPQTGNSPVNELAFAVKQMMAQYDRMVLVQVLAVHAGSGSPPGPTTVDVKPLVQQIDGNNNAVSHGTVPGIPVKRIQGGPWTIICDPAVGDIGYVTAADRDISKVKANAAEAPPGSLRMFDIADGVYEGAVLMKPTTAYVWLKSDGTLKLADKAGFVVESDGSGNGIITGNLTVQGNLIAAQNLELGGLIQGENGGAYSGNIHTTGTVTGDTDVVAGGISGKGHIHGGVVVGSGDTGTPI